MKPRSLICTVCILFIVQHNFAQNIRLSAQPENKKVDVLIDGKLFTSLLYADTLKKPVLYPIHTANNTAITRGWPLSPKIGDKVDHPHQFGLWFTYGDVNGADYWNNSTRVDSTKTAYGRVQFKKLLQTSGGKGKASVTLAATWINPGGKITLEETTQYIFRAENNLRMIDRYTTLKAVSDVEFKDSKEGLFGLRVARKLEGKATKAEPAYLGPGNILPVLDNMDISGNYFSSEGKQGDAVFGTRAKWVKLAGKINNENISLVMIDHPGNVNYPAYWMARGYGLFAINPLGASAYTNGKEVLNYSLKKGQQVTFKYRLVIADEIENSKIESLSNAFKAD